MTVATFEPRWASAPGATILDALHDAGLSVEDLADAIHVSDAEARRLVRGEVPITAAIAEALVGLIGGSAAFWLRRESQYRDDAKWVSADDLLSSLPYQQMAEFGWIEGHADWRGRVGAALEFFAVGDSNEWFQHYGRALELTQLRASPTFEVSEIVLAAWLRQAALEAAKLHVGTWDRAAFLDTLRKARSLTKVRDPQVFLPELQEMCASTGVAVVVVRAPKGCPVNGAATESNAGVRTIVLSGRHLSDDQLWFTFFHEAGHVVLHERGTTFVDALDGAHDGSSIESEADAFAQSLLRPAGFDQLGRSRSSGKPSMREIVSIASSEGIAPGLVVGQLQHEGKLRFDQLNGLKRRYHWDGPTLRI